MGVSTHARRRRTRSLNQESHAQTKFINDFLLTSRQVLQMFNYPELSGQWEVVARHANYGWGIIALQVLLGILVFEVVAFSAPRTFTWRIRHKSTGETRTVTANSADDAVTKINNGQFEGRADAAVRAITCLSLRFPK
jgi:hypothetical protein